MTNLIHTIYLIYSIINATIVFLMFLIILEMNQKNISLKLLKTQSFYIVFFTFISYFLGGIYYSFINTNINFLTKTQINLFFMTPFLQFVTFYLLYFLGEEVLKNLKLKNAFLNYLNIIFTLIVLINYMIIVG